MSAENALDSVRANARIAENARWLIFSKMSRRQRVHVSPTCWWYECGEVQNSISPLDHVAPAARAVMPCSNKQLGET